MRTARGILPRRRTGPGQRARAPGRALAPAAPAAAALATLLVGRGRGELTHPFFADEAHVAGGRPQPALLRAVERRRFAADEQAAGATQQTYSTEQRAEGRAQK